MVNTIRITYVFNQKEYIYDLFFIDVFFMNLKKKGGNVNHINRKWRTTKINQITPAYFETDMTMLPFK